MAWAWQGHDGAVGPFELIWTGKAVRSVWAGFTWPKVGYLWDGMVAYLLGAGVAAIPGIPGWDIWRYTATVWMLAIAAVALPMLWRARHDPRRARAGRDLRRHLRGRRGVQSLFPAAGSADADQRHGLADGRPGRWCWWRRAQRCGGRGLAALAGLTVALFAYNVWSLAPLRGLDSAWQQAIERLEREADPGAHRLR